MIFASDEDLAVANEYSANGYIIRVNADKEAFNWIQKNTAAVAASALKIDVPSDIESFLNKIHKLVEPSALNDFRLKVIQGLNALPE
ncbi:MAG: 2OG-Fe(II) oxygenase, partial [Acidimicrobiia bacterium]|nr:2OG-Fe(II) oxygenase [Acidimicrobiia bacterium]